MAAKWTTTDAELMLTVEECQDRELWLAWRRKGIGSSEMAALMGEGRYADQTEYDVWLTKTGRAPDKEVTMAMEAGNLFEDAIARRFSEKFGLNIRRCGLLRSKRNPLVLSNVDRLTDDGGVLEVKLVNAFTKMPSDGSIPRHWFWQMVDHMAVTGADLCHLAVCIGSANFQERVLYREDVREEIERIFEVVPEFWGRYVVEDVAPEVGAPEALTEVEKQSMLEVPIPAQLWEYRTKLEELAKVQSDAKAEADEIKDELKAIAGAKEILTANGIPVIRVGFVKGRLGFKESLARADYPDFDAKKYMERGAGHRAITLIKEKEKS